MPNPVDTPNHRYKFPAWVRCASLIWLAIWLPAYWRTWGVENFLHLCDITVILTCAGLFWSNALLLSSQATATIIPDLLWDVDAASRLFFGRNLLGGTEYMWDAHYTLWVRLLSLFHVVWPLLLLWSLKRVGYSRRGFVLQEAIGAAAMIAARFTSPSLNINYAFRDPLLHRPWGPAPIHVALMWIGLVILMYLPTHLVLKNFFAPPGN
jgi:hypothetical protein